MRFLSSLPIARKLPVLIVTLCLTASLSIAVVGYLDFVRNIRQDTQDSFALITESRAVALAEWGARLENDVAALGRDPTVVAAASGFGSAFGLMVDSAGLQEAYVTKNPNSPDARDQFDQAPDAIPYHFQHGRFHPHFRQLANAQGYGDLVILNLSGDVMYSVRKRADYATTVATGPQADTPLGQAFAGAVTASDGDVVFADYAPYAANADRPTAFLSTPVLADDGGGLVGVIVVEVPSDQIAGIVGSPLGLGQTGEVYLVGPDGMARSPSRFAGRFGLLADMSALPQAKDTTQSNAGRLIETHNLAGTQVFATGAPVRLFDRAWALLGEIDRTEVKAPVVAVRNKMVAVTAIIAAASTFIGWMVARTFVLPLGRLGAAMRQVSEKTYDIVLPEEDRKDEIGALAQRLMEFREKLQASDAAQAARREEQDAQKRIVDRLSLGLGQLSRGDLTQKITERFAGDYDQLRQDFNHTVDRLNAALSSLRNRADEIRSRADDMSSAADDLSRRTESQAATLEETAAALDEMTASVRSAAAGAKEVASVVSDARHDADESRPVVESAVQAMHAIANSSEEISKIIGVIDDIAFQTNLLALNAGVEAARAGEAGRGFAVVASEVRALAQRSSDAAKQIKGLIGQSTHQVQDGVDLVGKAGDVLTKIAGHISHISNLIGNIASGAEEQSTGLGEINIGVTQLDKVTQQNAAMVEQATANSHALKGDARDLAELVQGFSLAEGTVELAAFAADAASDSVVAPSLARLPDAQTTSRPLAAISGRGSALAARSDIWQDF